MPAIFEHSLVVDAQEIDSLGHVNNLAYMTWILDAALAHSAAQGWPQSTHFARRSGWVVRSHQITYLKPAFVGDVLVVRTWVDTMKRVTSGRQYRIIRPRDQVMLATAQTEWAYINFDTLAPTRIPQEVASAFQVVRDAPPVP